MKSDEVLELVETLRRVGGESEKVEAKTAAGGFPDSLRATLSAFANTDGGTVLLGVDERQGFAIVGVTDPAQTANQLAQMARDDITPPLSFPIEIVEVEGVFVVAAQVPPTAAMRRPVYVTARGVATGSFTRSGDGDRRLTQDEVGLMFAGRSQPRDDMEAVEGTTLDDLDPDSLARTLQRIRSAVSSLRTVSQDDVLFRLRILANRDIGSPVTLAGLLAFGIFPQQFFPQLMASIIVRDATDSHVRFTDNVTLRGSIPQMVSDALAVVSRSLRTSAIMSAKGRQDRSDYPTVVVREAIVNALLHRDYSSITRGTQVQIEITPELITVRSPGGLYGGISVADLGATPITSSRNSALAALLPDTFLPQSNDLVSENRASGIVGMISEAGRAGFLPPTFRDSPASFLVTLPRSPQHGGKAPVDLVAELPGRYRQDLVTSTQSPTVQQVMDVLAKETWMSAGSISEAVGLARSTVTPYLRDLLHEGVIIAQGSRNSPARRYRIA